jgi:hypothetical protein
MKLNLLKRCATLLAVSALYTASADFITFSIDPASPSINGNITPDDILVRGPLVIVQGTSLGLYDHFHLGQFDNLDALTYGKDPIRGPVYFSVDRVAVGLPGTAVFDQAKPGVESAAGDVFMALPPFGNNVLVVNETDLGLRPGFFGDDLNALNMDTKFADLQSIYFSIDALSARNGYGSGTLANDIFLNDINTIYASGEDTMRLDPYDDIDAFVLLDFFNPGRLDPGLDLALFSLSKFSPSTWTGGSGPWSPGDILFTDFTGRPPTLWASAASIGLQRNDELDALDTVPEPGPIGLSTVVLAAGAAVWFRKHRLDRKSL